MEGKEDFILTGQLGEVMRESARAGLSWTRAHASELGHRARGLREEHAPHPRPGRRHPQGRSVRRDHDGHGDGQRPDRDPRPQGRGDDRRDHPARSGPPDRRAQEQDPGRPPLGCQDRHPARARTRRTCATSPRRSASRSSSSSSTPWTRSWRRPSGASRRPSVVEPPKVIKGDDPIDPSPAVARPTDGLPADGPAAGRRSGAPDREDPRMARWRARIAGPRVQGLLRGPRRAEDRVTGRHQEGVPQARPPAPSRRQARRHGRGATLQGSQRGQRGPLRPRQAQALRHLGANWGAYGRAAGQGGDPFGPGGPFAGFSGRRLDGRPGGGVRYEFHTTGDAGEFSDFFRVFFGDDAPRGATSTGPGRGRRPTGGPTFEEILGGMGIDGAAMSAGGRRPGGAASSTRAAPKPTAEAAAEITLDEAYQGTTRLVDVDGKRLEVDDPARRRHRDPRPSQRQGARWRRPVRRRPDQARHRCSRGAGPTSNANCR